LAVAGLLSLAGCLDTHAGRPTHGSRPSVVGQHSVPGVNAPLPDHWVRVFVGHPRPRLTGYVRSETLHQDSDHPLLVHWVYDVDFDLVGVVSDNGHTSRFDRFGKTHFLGEFPFDKSILAVFDMGGSEEDLTQFIHYVPMPEPKE
jgi:hypothetical protein